MTGLRILDFSTITSISREDDWLLIDCDDGQGTVKISLDALLDYIGDNVDVSSQGFVKNVSFSLSVGATKPVGLSSGKYSMWLIGASPRVCALYILNVKSDGTIIVSTVSSGSDIMLGIGQNEIEVKNNGTATTSVYIEEFSGTATPV